jgi:hypothetical protein
LGNFPCRLVFSSRTRDKCRTSDVAEKNKEMIRLIGRRLREAAAAADVELPTSILNGLEQLSEIECRGSGAGLLLQDERTVQLPGE